MRHIEERRKSSLVLLQHLLTMWRTLSPSVCMRCLPGYGDTMSRLRRAQKSRADLMAQMISFLPSHSLIITSLKSLSGSLFVYNSDDAFSVSHFDNPPNPHFPPKDTPTTYSQPIQLPNPNKRLPRHLPPKRNHPPLVLTLQDPHLPALPTGLNAIQLLLYLVQQEAAFLAASGKGSLGGGFLICCCGLVKDW